MAKATIQCLTLHKSSLAAKSQENIAKVQEKLEEEEIDKMVEGDEVKESYASEFANLVLNDDVDNSSTRLEPERAEADTNSLPTRSPRNGSSFDKTCFEELTATVSPTTATTSRIHPQQNARKYLFLTRQRFSQEVLLACEDDMV
nr:hypothetical protein [Tanacetum cinerariifolium]